ncbi:hypothetical protein C8R45DRAFT_1151680 [Mycena sanguinolenta]|nr:hypothetical protein C8R45DRAFT_1151680 [Mycena sanguinolenta]
MLTVGDPKRVDGNVQFCTDVNSAGDCQVFIFTNGVCHNFSKHDTFHDKVSSFTPDIGVECTLFQDGNCSGVTIDLGFPGSHDLDAQNFNDRLTSFICNRVGPGGP